jgi:hypothetical protein
MRQIYPVGKKALVNLFLIQGAIWDQQLDDAIGNRVQELCGLAERECESFVKRWTLHAANLVTLSSISCQWIGSSSPRAGY